MSSADEQVILRCSTVERDLDILYCRSLRNSENQGVVVTCVEFVKLRKSKKS